MRLLLKQNPWWLVQEHGVKFPELLKPDEFYKVLAKALSAEAGELPADIKKWKPRKKRTAKLSLYEPAKKYAEKREVDSEVELAGVGA